MFSALPTLDNVHEERAFHFFLRVTVPVLASAGGSEFWSSLVLKLCHLEAAVRHSIIALSVLHETVVRNGLPKKNVMDMKVFALHHYDLAIKNCIRRLQGLDHSLGITPLLLSIIFVYIEVMQKKEVEALEFIRQGRHLLRSQQITSLSSRAISSVKESIVPIYHQIGLVAHIFGCSVPPVPVDLDDFTNIPGTFTSVAEARHCLFATVDASYRWRFNYRLSRPSDEGCSFSSDEQTLLLSRLSQWHTAFTLLTVSQQKKGSESASALLLQVYYHLGKIITSTATSTSQSDYDRYVESFGAILLLASDYLAQVTSATVYGTPEGFKEHGNVISPDDLEVNLSACSFEPGVIPALYFTALKCRHPRIRRAARDLLLQYGTAQENLWTALVVAKVAERLIDYETAMASDVAVEEARATISANGEREASLLDKVRDSIESS